MDAAAVAARSLNAKRSTGPSLTKQDSAQDSPAYDASDEDASDRTESDPNPNHSQTLRQITRSKQPKGSHQGSHLKDVVDSDTGTDSPTYDGDIESSTNAVKQTVHHRSLLSISSADADGSPTSTPVATPSASLATLQPATANSKDLNHLYVPAIAPANVPSSPKTTANLPFNPPVLAQEDIQAFIRKAIEGEPHRKYKINKPPTDRPVRVYADGSHVRPAFGSLLLTTLQGSTTFSTSGKPFTVQMS